MKENSKKQSENNDKREDAENDAILNEAKENTEEITEKNIEEDYRSQFLRSVANLENFRKRVAKEKQELIRIANASLIEDLLPVIDTMKLGLDASEKHPEACEIKKGFEMVLEQMNRVLEEKGLIEISPDGKQFDPNKHESISYQPSEEIPEGEVIQTIRTGYILNDRLIRAANVIVSSGKSDTK